MIAETHLFVLRDAQHRPAAQRPERMHHTGRSERLDRPVEVDGMEFDDRLHLVDGQRRQR